jgi:penicillin amidase
MSWFIRLITLFAFLIIALAVLASFVLPRLDSYQIDGQLSLPALQEPVTVQRDAFGVPYISAQSLDDAITAQGFIVAQDRLFQMELFKSLANGRLAELIGEKGLKSDRLVRLLDFRSLAQAQIMLLTDEERNYLQRYINGVNSYIRDHVDTHPLVFQLMKIEPQAWQLLDIVVLQFFQIWSSSANWQQELLTLALIDKLGVEKAAALAPLNINPDSPEGKRLADFPRFSVGNDFIFAFDDSLFSEQRWQHAMGSNAWASGQRKSKNAAPVLANDPHIDSRRLPGFWYPMGITTPELRVVGAAAPGSPGFGVARTNYIAWGATNGYSDMVDLYIEREDPNNPSRYLEGDKSLPFMVREEVIKIKDDELEGGYREEKIRIRSTRRGPLISDHAMSTVEGKAISLRWSVPEFLGSQTGNLDLLMAHSLSEARTAIGKMAVPLNYVVVDYSGNIARISSGFVPKRVRGNGLLPLAVTSKDSWDGRIPAEEMPAEINPRRDWVGTTNHNIVPGDYPYAYSTHFSPSWRYRRLIELFTQEKVSSQDHWRFLMDNKNMMAEAMVPVFVRVLRGQKELSELAGILGRWDYFDSKEQAAPLIFHTLYRHFARRVYVDELGEEVAPKFLDETYYYQERMVSEFMHDSSPWYDDIKTAGVESRDDLILMAAQDTLKELSASYGNNPASWQWGEGNTLTFFHSFIPGVMAARWLGGGVHAANGSVETLNRAISRFSDPGHVKIIPSMRFVADLSDPDKVEGHIPGGVSERLFSSYAKNQLSLWLSGEPSHWWYSDKAIKENTRHTLSLLPK